MLNDKYPFGKTCNRIAYGEIKLKPEPCTNCVVNITCTQEDDDLCKDRIDYYNLKKWIYWGKVIFYKDGHTKVYSEDPDFIVKICSVRGTSIKRTLARYSERKLTKEEDRQYREYLLNKFINFENSDIIDTI